MVNDRAAVLLDVGKAQFVERWNRTRVNAFGQAYPLRFGYFLPHGGLLLDTLPKVTVRVGYERVMPGVSAGKRPFLPG